MERGADGQRYDPNYSDGYATRAAILGFLGEGADAEGDIRHAMSLNPRFPSAYTEVLGRAQLIQKKYEEASASFRDCVDLDPQRLTCWVYLAAIYGLTGDEDEAEWTAQEILALNPSFTLDDNVIVAQFESEEDRRLLREGLSTAGFPE